ncbi:hypothetical protein BH10PSE7_BH10PSE7_37650 [soil metagenome]
MFRMRAVLALACFAVALAAAAASARADVENDKVLYLKTAQALARICTDMWEIKDREELNAKEKELLARADTRLDHVDQEIDELAEQLKKAKLEYKEKDTSLNLGVVQAVEDYAKTGGEVDTKNLKSLGKSLAQGGTAAASAADAEAKLDEVRETSATIERIRARLTSLVIGRKLVLIAKSRIKVCAADQREYLGGPKKNDDEGNGPGWAGTIAGESTVNCEQGMPAPDKNKKWEETVRFKIRLNPPHPTSKANVGRGTFDFAGISHRIAGFAGSDATFVASAKDALLTISLLGKVSRAASGSLSSDGDIKISIDTSGKLVGSWLGTLCEGKYSF